MKPKIKIDPRTWSQWLSGSRDIPRLMKGSKGSLDDVLSTLPGGIGQMVLLSMLPQLLGSTAGTVRDTAVNPLLSLIGASPIKSPSSRVQDRLTPSAGEGYIRMRAERSALQPLIQAQRMAALKHQATMSDQALENLRNTMEIPSYQEF